MTITTEQVIADPLTNDTIVDLGNTPHITVRANTSPATVGSVSLQVSGAGIYTRTENVLPCVLAGDNGTADVLPWTPPAGSGAYVLTATPYTDARSTGTGGQSLSVRFQITNTPAVASLR